MASADYHEQGGSSPASPVGRKHELRVAAQAAFARAAKLEARVLKVFPDAWDALDHMRANPPTTWPEWCLLPLSAPVALVWGSPTPDLQAIAPMTVLYKWRFARSVWIIEPTLVGRLASTVPDTWGLQAMRGLPQWCVYVWAPNPNGTGVGMWLHLEYDERTHRPYLLLMIDPGAGGIESLVEIPVALDHATVTEALAEFRARDPDIAKRIERVEAHLAVAAHLARPAADVQNLDRLGVVPTRPKRPMRGNVTDVWLVGYADLQ